MLSSLFVLLAAAIPSFAVNVHEITVGGTGILAFSPNNISAAVGDVINFTFHQTNHTATQSSFATPCVELQDAEGVWIGFDSGFMPVAADMTSDFPTFAITVNDTNPIWVFCRQTGHCGKGMVFSANAPATGNTFETFQAEAIAQNGTAAASATVAPTPVVSIVTVTATVTVSGDAVLTTYGSYPGSPAPTVASTPTDHRVIVGGTAGLVYTPDTVSAEIGDTVTFEFHSANHTATQSSFGDPCRKLALTSTTGQVGFDSGFMPVSANATTFPTVTITVNNTTPIWVYCRQNGHCGKGMVFAVNPPATGNTFQAFQALALQLNGTSTSASPSATSTHANGAPRRLVDGKTVAFGVVAGAALLFL